MKVTIQESGLDFGEYEKSDVFLMEESLVYKSLPDNISTVEFVLRRKADEILFVEAKRSSPNQEKLVDFELFIDKICNKFAHSIDLFFSLVLKRLGDTHNDMPNYFKTVDYSVPEMKLLLVLNDHPLESLSPISSALHKKLKRQIKTWRFGLTVMNHELAKEYGLLKQ